MHTCNYCHKPYPDEHKYWRTRTQCRACYNKYNREHSAERLASLQIKSDVDDPVLIPPQARVAVSCFSCNFYITCRSNVCVGRQVLCAPVHESDILLEKAYQERKVSLCL